MPIGVRNIVKLLLPILVTFSVLAIPIGLLMVISFIRSEKEATWTIYDKRSGQGENSIVPEEIKGWNWGAFALGVIWGARFNVWLSLLIVIPLANIVYMFFAGAMGSEWAWRKSKWESVEAFKKSRRRWNIAGLILLPVLVVLVALGAILDAAEEELRQNDTLDPISEASTATSDTPEAAG